MSKAVLIIDLPKSCDMCPFCEGITDSGTGEPDYLFCEAPGIGEEVDDYEMSRPKFCPLVELPEKENLNRVFLDDDGEVFYRGWNACLDTIMGVEADD